jgi:hypothetical protein
MSQFDLNIKNYDYNELLNLFKIKNSDNRNEVLFKLDKKMSTISKSNFEDYIVNFYKKCKTIISTVNELLLNGTIKFSELESFMNKIHRIDETDNVALLSSMELLNKIRNSEVELNVEYRLNAPYYNVNKLDYVLNDKNNTNIIVNTAVNEVSPGDLNSIKRITQLLNLNLNSCFRSNYYQSSPTDFLYNLPTEIKNVLSLRVVSVELPNSWYLFSSKKKNNIFYICAETSSETKEYKIEIPDGNYSYDTLENFLNATYFYESVADYPLRYIRFLINPHNLKSCFINLDAENYKFTVRFSQNSNDNIINTCGWILGYRFATYTNFKELISEGLFDAGGDRYVFLSINDFQYNNNTSNIVCFDNNILNEDVIAKIPMVNGKLSLIINDNNNALSKIRRYNGPVNLSKIQIKLLDHFGSIIDLNNMDFSMTLELQILYENFNFKNITA